MEEKVFNLYTMWERCVAPKPTLVEYITSQLGISKPEIDHYIERLKLKQRIKKPNKKIAKKPIEKPVKKKRKKIKLPRLNILQITMYFLFLSCLFTSVMYSFIWRIDELKPAWALLTSFTMVLYGSIGFSLSKRYDISKGVKFALKTTAALVLIFSVAQTIAGQYKGFNKADDIALTDTLLSNQRELERMNTTRNRLLKDLEKIDNDKALFDDWQKNAYFKTAYENKLKEESLAEEALKEIEKNITNKENEIIKFKTKNTVTIKTDFFVWITSSLLPKVNAEVLKFWFYLFPAIFVDVMGPISLYIAMSKGGVKNDKK